MARQISTPNCFNTQTAQHKFCRHCGAKSFYVPRSNPDGYSINLRCLEAGTIEAVELVPFDGQNWEDNLDALPVLDDD